MKSIHLWFLSFTLSFQHLFTTHAQMSSLLLKPAFSENPSIKRLLRTTLESWQHFILLIFLVCTNTWGTICKTPRSSSTALQGFSSHHAVVTFFLQTWLYRALGGLWQAGRWYGADSQFLFPDPSPSQTLRRSCPDPDRRSWDEDMGTSSWFVCLRNYFPHGEVWKKTKCHPGKESLQWDEIQQILWRLSGKMWTTVKKVWEPLPPRL